MTSKAEFVYFDGRGRGEIVRLALAAAGIEFTEKHLVTREQFLALEPDLLYNQVPLLRIDGLNLVQSSSTVRYLARKANLLGDKEPDIVRIDMVYEGSRDLMGGVFMGIGFQYDETKLVDRLHIVNKYLTVFDKLLKDNHSTGYFVGNSLTLADIGVLEPILASIDYFGKEVLNDYPEVLKYYNTVISLERIANYISAIRKPPNSPEYVSNVKKVLAF